MGDTENKIMIVLEPDQFDTLEAVIEQALTRSSNPDYIELAEAIAAQI